MRTILFILLCCALSSCAPAGHSDVAGPSQSPRVLIFILHDCPICNAFIPEVNRLVADFPDLDFQVVDVDQDVPEQTLRQHAREYGLSAPLLLDPQRALARRWGITTGGLGGWSPGAFPPPLPDGYGRPLRKGSDLVIQTHFHPTGKIEQEQSSIGIYFTKAPPSRLVRSFPIGNRRIDIPPGDSQYKVAASVTTPIAVELTGIIPHAHLICKEMRVWATFPDGRKQDLIWIKDWDFNWQDQYVYKTPLHLPRGTKVDMEFTYDNSAANERNPSNPPQRVRFGEQTTNEMAFTFLQIVPEGFPDLSRLRDALRPR